MEKFQKTPANRILNTLACLLAYVCVAHVLYIPLRSENKKKTLKLDVAYNLFIILKI